MKSTVIKLSRDKKPGADPARSEKRKKPAQYVKNHLQIRVIERRGKDSNNLKIPLKKPEFQNEPTQNPTRAAKYSVRCRLQASAATLSWKLNRLLAHPFRIYISLYESMNSGLSF